MADLNDRYPTKFAGLAGSLRAGASVLALGCLLAWTPALAQDDPTTTEIDDTEDGDAAVEGDAILVTGIRASLANSQDIKRDSDTVVDAITAEDIGALPDRSVTEALQRVPGVAINRFAGSNDPDHFSVEGAGVVIRGLNFVRGEFNGRDAFSANGGRQLGFNDVPAELLGSVVVAKNLTAEMIEGGLAGTVNLNTRVPFDRRGFHIAGTLEANYSDLIEEVTPQGSFLISDTWDTESGTWGFLAAVSYSQIKSRSDGIQVTNFQTRDGALTGGSNNSGPVTRTRLPGKDVAYAPLGGQFRTQDYDRQRLGIAAAAQWESVDETLVATLQFIRSNATSAWGEHTFESGPDLAEYNTFPAAGTDYEYDANNVFESGYITLPGTGWRSGAFNGQGNADGRVATGGVQQSLSRRMVDQETTNQDFGFNVKFTPDDRWAFNFDAQYTEATTENLDVSVFGSTFADTMLDLTGGIPSVIVTKPQNTRATWAAPNEMDGLTDEQYFSSNRYTFWRAAMDHIEDSEGHEFAFRGDTQYSFDPDNFIKRLKLGFRYADRDQTVRSTTYNWGRLSEVWAGNNGSAVFFDEFGANQTEFFEFPNFFRGATPGPVGGWYYSGNLVDDYNGSSAFFRSIDDYFRFGQAGPASGQGTGWVPLAERPNAVNGTPFLPSEIQIVSETTTAGYGMLSFGNDEYADYPTISGNIGVRYVGTDVDSAGSIQFPPMSTTGFDQGTGTYPTYADYCAPELIDPDGPEGPLPPQPRDLPAVCDLSEAQFLAVRAFSNGASAPDVAQNDYENWLPSLNLKLEVNDELQIRFAASRAMARPDFSYIRNFVTVGTNTQAGFRFQGGAGNPFLNPALADQFDLSAEWYFDDVGSLTLTGFYKSIKDFFYQDVTERQLTNGGQTFTVFITGPANYSAERGKVKGFELAYQQTFDFLPGVLSGLGVNGNYTFIDSKGIPNSILDTPNAPTITPGNLPLEQLSKHNFNATAFYEKGPLSLRASYSWRSRFLLTSRDVIHPFFPVYNAGTGQLDASIFFNVTPNIKLALQGTNLLNEVTKTEQQFTADGLIGPRSYFINDRRFTFGVRASW
ncbi:MAG TPA: TonB-dependent receptor [Croceibacterium sp.]|nr:TonB-dependent receptor [Croceibacterium sp.]